MSHVPFGSEQASERCIFIISFLEADGNLEKEGILLSGGTYFFAIFSKFTHCQLKRQRASVHQ